MTGFIEKRQGPLGGAFVKEINFGLLNTGFADLYFSDKLTISEVVQVRQIIEPEMARLAALNINDSYRKKLTIALQEEQQEYASEDDLMKKLTAVHFILAEMCNNRLFQGLINAMISLTRIIIRAKLEDLLSLHGPGEHDKIVEAVLKGDSEAAGEAMLHHCRDFGTRFVLKLEK